MEIIIDKKGKSLAKYSDKEITQIYNSLSDVENVSGLKRSISKNNTETTTTEYINFKMNRNSFKIRFSDHTRKSFSNEILLGVEFDTGRGHFLIDASLGKYGQKEILEIVKTINDRINKYSKNKESQELNSFIDEKLNDEDYCEGLGAEDLSFEIAKDYMIQKQINDDKFGISFQAIRSLAFKNITH